MEILENYFNEIEKKEIEKIKECLFNYMQSYDHESRKTENLFFEIETNKHEGYLFIMAHCGEINKHNCFNTAYMKACFDLGQNKYIYKDINILGGKKYTIKDSINCTKNYFNSILKDLNNIKA